MRVRVINIGKGRKLMNIQLDLIVSRKEHQCRYDITYDITYHKYVKN